MLVAVRVIIHGTCHLLCNQLQAHLKSFSISSCRISTPGRSLETCEVGCTPTGRSTCKEIHSKGFYNKHLEMAFIQNQLSPTKFIAHIYPFCTHPILLMSFTTFNLHTYTLFLSPFYFLVMTAATLRVLAKEAIHKA